jgi:hypothetical protein
LVTYGECVGRDLRMYVELLVPTVDRRTLQIGVELRSDTALAASDSGRSPTGAVSCHAMSDAIRERKYWNGSEDNVSSGTRA